MTLSSRPVATGKPKKRFRGFSYFLLILPFLAIMFVFAYYPLHGWIYAFYDYRPPLRLDQSDFVGLYWFKYLVSNPFQVGQVVQVLKNTFAMSGLGILTSWMPLLFAIMISQVRSSKFKRFVQTLTTIPNFISWILVFSFAYALFSSSGAVNVLMQQLGLSTRPIMFLQQSNHVWLTMWLWGTWKGLGWGSIMYIAAIAGIDQELYDAAEVDGAGRYRLIWHITVPGLLPTYFVLLLLSIANFLNNGFDQYYVFKNAFNINTIQVLDLYVYNLATGAGNYSFATAVSILKSFVSLALLFGCNGLSKALRGESII